MFKRTDLPKHIALIALAFLLVCGGLTLLQVRETTKELPRLAQETIHTEFEATRNLVSVKLDAVDKRVEFLSVLVDARLGKLEFDTFTELGSIRKGTFEQLTAIRTEGLQAVTTQLTETNKHVGTLVGAYAGIPQALGVRYEKDWALYFNCAKNKLCLQGQASDTLLAVRSTSRDVSGMTFEVNKIMPSLSKSADSIAKSGDSVAASGAGIMKSVDDAVTDYLAPKTFWQKVQAWAEALVYAAARFL